MTAPEARPATDTGGLLAELDEIAESGSAAAPLAVLAAIQLRRGIEAAERVIAAEAAMDAAAEAELDAAAGGAS